MWVIEAIGFVIVWALLGGGLWFLGLSLWQLLLVRDSQNWPTTTGIINDTHVRVERDRLGGIFGWHNYWAEVHYRYQVAGQTYDGKQVLFGYRGLSRAAANAIAVRYVTGRSAAVYYHPGRPSLAVLQSEISGAGLAYQVGIGLGLYTAGAIVAVGIFHW